MLLRQSSPASAGGFLSEDQMSYEFKEYPAWVSNGEESKLVQNREEHAALGEGWKLPEHAPFVPREQSPDFQEYPKWVNGVIVADAEAEAALIAQIEPQDERAALLQFAEEKGVQIDKRWSDAKIRAAIESAE